MNTFTMPRNLRRNLKYVLTLGVFLVIFGYWYNSNDNRNRTPPLVDTGKRIIPVDKLYEQRAGRQSELAAIRGAAIHIIPGRAYGQTYNLEPAASYSDGRANLVLEILKNAGIHGRYFVEYGGGVAQFRPISLELETKNNWTGLIIEPDISLFSDMRAKYRNCALLNACLVFPNKTADSLAAESGVPCHRMDDILATITNPVDALLINSPGNELNIFKSMTFHRHAIHVISVAFDTSTFRDVSDLVNRYLMRYNFRAKHSISTLYKQKIEMVYIRN